MGKPIESRQIRKKKVVYTSPTFCQLITLVTLHNGLQYEEWRVKRLWRGTVPFATRLQLENDIYPITIYNKSRFVNRFVLFAVQMFRDWWMLFLDYLRAFSYGICFVTKIGMVSVTILVILVLADIFVRLKHG